ncbi:MAG: WYL domain-containing protein [Myxococcales bacterium]|nr:WYL domain-containing protein [Myxococcota bacterium]MDW8283406.1 WYL domain-containing protein [Myxococcales bacterium]
MEPNARLRRLLYLVPAVLRRPGISIRELAEELSVDERTVREDVELLCMVGPPAGGPDEFLLLSIEDDRVYADLPQGLTRPLRLTAAEAFSLTLGLRALAGSGVRPYEDAVARLLAKIRAALGEALPGLAALERQSVIEAGEDHSKLGLLGELHRAVSARRPVEIVYHSASRGTTETRGVDPYALVNHRGVWYLVGRCHRHDEPRTFRVERISAVTPQPGSFTVPVSFDLEQFRRDNLLQPSPDYPTVRLRFDPPLAYEVRTRFDPAQVQLNPDGSLEVTMENPLSAWLVSWVLGFGPGVQVLEPQALRQAVAEQARAISALHQGEV